MIGEVPRLDADSWLRANLQWKSLGSLFVADLISVVDVVLSAD